MGWTKAPGTYVADVQLSLHVEPPTTGVDFFSYQSQDYTNIQLQ